MCPQRKACLSAWRCATSIGASFDSRPALNDPFACLSCAYSRRWRKNESGQGEDGESDGKDSAAAAAAADVAEASQALHDRMREMFKRAQQYASTIPDPPAQHEALFVIAKYWTDVEARQLRNIDAARSACLLLQRDQQLGCSALGCTQTDLGGCAQKQREEPPRLAGE